MNSNLLSFLVSQLKEVTIANFMTKGCHVVFKGVNICIFLQYLILAQNQYQSEVIYSLQQTLQHKTFISSANKRKHEYLILSRISLIKVLNKEVPTKPCVTFENRRRREERFPEMPTEENLDDK